MEEEKLKLFSQLGKRCRWEHVTAGEVTLTTDAETVHQQLLVRKRDVGSTIVTGYSSHHGQCKSSRSVHSIHDPSTNGRCGSMEFPAIAQ